MKINLRLLQEIKQYIPPAEFYRTELSAMPPLRKHGWHDGGLCPFHDDKRTGSFHVNLETGAFKCFSCGAKGGDIVTFIQQRDALTFNEALQKLSDGWGWT
ncbi:MAG: CHC2 zinc finger domain-containing protein [Nitrosospira sp.]